MNFVHQQPTGNGASKVGHRLTERGAFWRVVGVFHTKNHRPAYPWQDTQTAIMKISDIKREGTSKLRRTEKRRAKAYSAATYSFQIEGRLGVSERVLVPRHANGSILYMVGLQAARLSKHSMRRTITRREVRSAMKLLRPKMHAAHQGA